MKRQECSLKNFIPIDKCAGLIDWSLEFGNEHPVDVEIGFGTGEHLINLAKAHPQRNFVGIEQDRKRLLKTARKITLEEKATGEIHSNIRLLGVDAWIVFERLFGPENIDNVYCLFPCPWPKKKHIKFRLFSQSFLKLLNSRLKRQGVLQVVTDSRPFFDWILEEVPGTGFVEQRDLIGPRYNTKFEKKWRGEGQEKFFQLSLTKQKQIEVPLKKEVVLKAYKVKEFNPQNFHFTNQEGPISVVFKDMVFDQERKKGMLLFVVAEENLTQNFWVSIAFKDGQWIISRAVGQNLLQTHGLAVALELVSRATVENAG